MCPFVGYLYGIVKYLVKTLDSHQGHGTVWARCKFRVSMYVQVKVNRLKRNQYSIHSDLQLPWIKGKKTIYVESNIYKIEIDEEGSR